MILGDAEITKVRDADTQKIKEIRNDAQTIRARKLDEIEKRYRDAEDKIQALMDKKGDLLRSPMTKKELLEYAKKSLRKERDGIMAEVIQRHLADCQKGHDQPFNQLAMKREFSMEKAWRYACLIVSEQDIDDAVSQMPEIGISSKEREKRLAEIDKEIDEQSAILLSK